MILFIALPWETFDKHFAEDVLAKLRNLLETRLEGGKGSQLGMWSDCLTSAYLLNIPRKPFNCSVSVS